ncbi:hypothetical protein V5O48_014438 [Marasmius crinis-equi]|uniref:AAA-ATPase-like domain-containing protein n=1 Tax=Marasmius crinis-equi TaxID=585013 RepID=A0ABR3EXB2_9AGAR
MSIFLSFPLDSVPDHLIPPITPPDSPMQSDAVLPPPPLQVLSPLYTPPSSSSSSTLSVDPGLCTAFDAKLDLRVVQEGDDHETHEDGNLVKTQDHGFSEGASSKTRYPFEVVSLPEYSDESIWKRLQEARISFTLDTTLPRTHFIIQLRSDTTEFKNILAVRHFCDRTPIFEVAFRYKCVLLKTPPGHGKTTTLSMIKRFYDVLDKDDFYSTFENTGMGFRIFDLEQSWEHSNCYVLTLDFGELNITDEDFNFNTEINTRLKEFIHRYRDFFPNLSNPEEWIDEQSAVQTLTNIMGDLVKGHQSRNVVVCIDNYDSPYWELRRRSDSAQISLANSKGWEFTRHLHDLLEDLCIWNRVGFIQLVMFAGRENIFGASSISSTIQHRVCDIVERLEVDPVGMLGFDKHDLQNISNRLAGQFHSLGLKQLAQEYLESEEGRSEWESVGKYYGLSCREMLHWFADRLEEKTRGIKGKVEGITVPWSENGIPW